jgi:hypothetical protein
MVRFMQLKAILSKIIPNNTKIRFLSHLPKLEDWRLAHPEIYPTFSSRFDLYDYVSESIVKNEKIIYLEFGVFEGESIQYWSEINLAQESTFWGFDTFTGLPESWEFFSGKLEKYEFDTGGKIPEIKDKRVAFMKGLFQETLSDFLANEALGSLIVIHIDADIYSAALYVLTQMDHKIKPGTIIIFDEFSNVLHEFRALDDYCAAYMRAYEVLGVTHNQRDYFGQIAIRML